MKTKLLLFIGLFYLGFLNSQTTYVPDNNFEQALIDFGLDTTLDDYVQTSDITSVTDLNLYDKGITDLTGIEDFSSLSNLDISNNSLTNLNLSQNTALLYLFCGECNLSSIDVSSNINLQELSIFNNSVTEIDLSSNSALIAIDLDSNALTDIDVSQNTNLEFISINNNQLDALDVSSNLALETLRVYTNYLTSLNLSNNSALIELTVLNNNLSNLNIKNGNNSNFKIQNGEREFDARNNKDLVCIQVDDEAFATTNFTNIDATTSFSVDCTTQNGLTYVPDDNFEQALIDLGHDDVLDDYVTTENIASLTNIDLSYQSISDATGLEAFVALEILSINNNNLTTLNTRANASLSNLNCSFNSISDLYILDNAALTSLIATANELTSLETSGNFDLETLSVANNQLEELVLLGNYALTYLDCGFNEIEELEVFSSFDLTTLIAKNNKIKKLELNGLSNLYTVTVNDNDLFILSLSSGNTEGINSFNALNNPNLYCIEVDNVDYATTNFTNIDEKASFNINCNFNGFTYVPDDLFEQKLIDLGLDDFLDDYVTTVYIKT